MKMVEMWYKGTANANISKHRICTIVIIQNILILSGDHIYKMDYNKMLDFHKEKKAEATIAVIEVPY